MRWPFLLGRNLQLARFLSQRSFKPKLMRIFLLITIPSYLLGFSQFPLKYERSGNSNDFDGPVYWVRKLTLNEDNTYYEEYSESPSKSLHRQKDFLSHKYESGNWSIDGKFLILQSEDGSISKLIIGENWRLYFVKLSDKKGRKFRKKH